MKTVTEQHLGVIIQEIMEDQRKVSKGVGEHFTGVSERVIHDELDKRLGREWTLVENRALKLTRYDIGSIASGRFLREGGQKLLMIWGIIALGLLLLAQWIHIVPTIVYWILECIAGVWFLLIYYRKQQAFRKEIRHDFEEAGINLGKE